MKMSLIRRNPLWAPKEDGARPNIPLQEAQKMRISKEKVAFLKKQITAVYPDAEVYLFGSRVDDTKKGGDVDILVLTDTPSKLSSNNRILISFFKQFGEQKIDLLVENDAHKPFVKVALERAIQL
jgi:uncharacterized protein